MYVDAGSSIVKENIQRFNIYMITLERSKSGILITSPIMQYIESQFSSGRLLETFGILNNSNFLNSPHYWAGFTLLRKDQSVLDVLHKYLEILYTDKWVITDDYGIYNSTPDFREHRHDQSIFSLLFKCCGCVVVDDYNEARKIGAPVIPSRLRMR